ncbi:glycosyl hydrolase family 25 [[Clostridium] hylemonae DSM 15053]|uniref:Glycosyl hydrolase family 25 n=2 Tax=[Clostridium] hylemonae TaxID=89153 RepID=C0C2D7_9FIRM|nr:GH25 family lysozyme [[Clostridium] hylemonae]EEG73561.1 glycosyl hydrolase family 25 [[Clostridium] hylemonae DSM 15053]
MKSKKILSLLLVAVFSCQTATVYADEGDGYQADEISEEQIYEKELPKFSIEDMNLIIGEQRYFYALPDDLNLQENELKVTVEDEAVVKIQIAAPESLEADIKDGVPENAQWYCAIGISQGETMICIQMGNKEKKIPVIVSGQEGDSEEKNEKNTEEGQIDGEAITKDKIAENTYNTFSVQTGWTEREGKKYYINGNGEACKGITKIEGVLYYFDENTGALTESAGWIDINGSRYFCNEEGKLYNRQFIKFGNIYYYMGADGSLQKGIFQADGKKYYADPATGQVNLKAGWIEDSGKRYFANEEGILYINQFIKFGSIYHYLGDDGSEQKGTFEVQGKKYHANSATGEIKLEAGWIEDDGKRYYADEEGVLYANQFIRFGNIYYYMGDDGSVQKGTFGANGKKYHANSDTGQIKLEAGWIEDNGKKYYSYGGGEIFYSQFISFGAISYYMGADGSIQKGVIQTGDKVYYADESTGQIQKKVGWIDSGGKRYFSNEAGILYSSQFISFGAVTYYMGADGSLQKGIIQAGDKVYYADESTGQIQRKVGWIDSGGKRYFSNEAGILYSSQFISFGAVTYYMGADGSLQKGIIQAGDKVYYADESTGQIQKKVGWIDSGGKRYFSNEAGILYSSQFISFGAVTYYMGADGSLQKGIIQAGDKVYYSDESTGQIQKKVGWIDSGGKRYFSNEAGILYSSQFISFGAVTYYMGNDGSLQKGIIQTGGKLYYADESTGQIQKKAGWIESGGKKYYSNEAGVLYSSQFISFGSNCYYMGADGSMQKGKQYINGKWYYFDEETGLMIRSTGWFSSGPNRYYQKSDGTLAIGYTDIDNIRYYFNSSGVLASKMGIDVSQWQGNIDWRKVKEAGVEFAFIRVGYRGSASGNLAADPYYKQNIEGALAAGIKVGVYFFSQATTVQEAREEASYTYNLIKNYNITYPVAFDTEYYDSAHSGRADKLSASTRTLLANIFCSEIRNYGYTAMIYSGTYFMNNNLQMSLLTNCLVWVAQYNKELQYKGTYKCWQYSSSGRVNGINGNVDMNVWIN